MIIDHVFWKLHIDQHQRSYLFQQDIMTNLLNIFTLVLGGLFLIAFQCQCQDLNAVLCNAKLTRKRGGVDTAFDGNDTIYIFNGHYFDPENGTGSFTDIMKYSISSDRLEVAGVTPGVRKFVPILNPEDETFYLLYYNTIYRFRPSTGEVSFHQLLPIRIMSSKYVQENAAKIWLFFNYENPQDILQFERETNAILRVGELGGDASDFGAASLHNGKIYLFMNNAGEGGTTVVTLDPDTLQQSHQITNSTFEILSDWSTIAFSLRNYIYLIDNLVQNGGEPVNGVVRFDPVTSTYSTQLVQGYPAQNGWQYSQGGVIYIEQYNRIYMFGGKLQNLNDPDDYHFTDNIWYINFPI